MNRRRFAALVLALAPLGCVATQGDTAAPARPDATIRPNVSVDVHAPARHSPALVGADRSPIEIVLTNRESVALDVSRLRAELDVARDGVAFRCPEATPLPFTREPVRLEPGATFTYERTMQCVLPLPGSYEVTLALRFGDRSLVPVARTFVVTAPPAVRADPRPISDAGLWAVMDSAPIVGRPSQRNHPQIVLALVNASRSPLELPALRVMTRVARVGTTAWCTSAPVTLAAPAALAAGGVHRSPVAVSCLGFAAPGTFDVEVELVSADRVVPLGLLRVDVSTHPALLATPPR